ncbi:protein phosphatase 1 regulatory subunit 37-like, partial [Mizuhopecten yessoensis]|uniref:protein phosphatase 1 regulatory subunit 37-like n=1 Tax=Mizuhopecten yessoensis TaxID=6573 RepID=UPI000B45E6FC
YKMFRMLLISAYILLALSLVLEETCLIHQIKVKTTKELNFIFLAEVWNNTDLITAYRNGCEQNNVRPLSKVLNQLQGIQNTGERHELLSLKAEKLDIRHCESLEEVLRRVQFKCIDLEACHLDDE